MTVNISSRHVGLRRIVDDVRRALALSDIPRSSWSSSSAAPCWETTTAPYDTCAS